MAIRTREELLTSIREHMGDDTSDDALALVEDITDTLTDMENRNNNNDENWEQKYKDNDAAWRKKYRDRFFSGKGEEEDDTPPEPTPKKKLTFENLFKEG